MCRNGISPILRCAVWTTNVIRTANPEQNRHLTDEYGTLKNIRAVDHGWETALKQVFPHPSDEKSAVVPDMGIGKEALEAAMEGATPRGRKAMKQVLCTVQHVLGVEYCPMLPDVAAVLLNCMPESYAYATIREMIDCPGTYLNLSRIDHYAWCKAFSDILKRFYPQTFSDMESIGATSPDGLDPICKRFFVGLLQRKHVLRVMDMYTIEGTKLIFRVGLALISLYKKTMKNMAIKDSTSWWNQIREFTHSPNFHFNTVLRRAYNLHGSNLRRRIRFPRRRIIQRMVKLNEPWAEDHAPREVYVAPPKPLGFVENNKIPLKLAQNAAVRAHLAQWLPIHLRSTKLDVIFSTDCHGRSLGSFYEECRAAKHTVTLVEVLDTGDVIGMYASQKWRVNNQIYGDGECFLFTMAGDTPKCYKWDPNDYSLEENEKDEALMEEFMIGRRNYLAMGGGADGTCGLRLNEDLTRAESATVPCFSNEPLAGRNLTEFDVGLVEVYRFVREVDGKGIDGGDSDRVWNFPG
mmetsp:Transcript_29452/g.35859  ORF Transcript_29452/g.35859 Transcript_29452/m.35859 type:complete len:521 (-) Transcript_29452:211-1773(-)